MHRFVSFIFIFIYLFIFFGVYSFKIRANLKKIFMAFLINFGIRIPAQLSASSPPQSKAKFKIGIKGTYSRKYGKIFIMNRLHLHSQLARQYIVQLNFRPITQSCSGDIFLFLDIGWQLHPALNFSAKR